MEALAYRARNDLGPDALSPCQDPPLGANGYLELTCPGSE